MTKQKVHAHKTTKNKPKNQYKRSVAYVIIIFFFSMLLLIGWHYRAGIKYYWNTKSQSEGRHLQDNAKYDIRNVEIMTAHSDKIFGIDVSQYQSKIKWIEVSTINDEFPIDFVFVRATMGERRVDDRFDENWEAIASRANLRGAYHYFRPNENSIKQAHNFIKTVQLKPGDLPPVLDIEELPKQQSMDSLKMGLKRWLDLVEAHYNIKPILYSGDKFYADFLHQEFKDYTLWIANYNFWVEDLKDHWDFWQFSEKGTVRGIKGNVDLNIFNGDIEDLEKLTIPYVK